jgi:NAD(P)-dependent dehydrogenase (short-subunit alcohol dehydrogenase family)
MNDNGRSRDDRRFARRRAIVTGASRGIGAAVAVALAELGADVAIVARSVEETPKIPGSLTATATTIEDAGGRCALLAVDLTDPEDRARIVPETVAALGGVDTLINNAAAALYAPPSEYSVKRRRISMEVNFHAPLDLMQAVIPIMRAQGEGWIVNLSSAAARPTPGPPYDLRVEIGMYGASKAALNRATNAFAVDVFADRIRVNTVEPRSAVLSEGAAALVSDQLRDGEIEPMETMVDAVLALCDCPVDRTGRNFVSLDLLADLDAAPSG